MTETTARQHYNELVKRSKDWQGLEGLSRQLTNFEDPQGQSLARASVKEIYARNHDVGVNDLEDIIDERLRDEITSEGSQARSSAVSYLEGNLNDVIEGIPKSKIEEKVYDVLPGIGIVPNKDVGGDHFKRHSAYLNANALVERFKKGEEKQGDEKQLLSIAAGQARNEIYEKSEEEGWDRETTILAAQAAGQAVYELRDRNQLIETGEEIVEGSKKAFKEGFDDNYTIADYGRELIRYYADKSPEGIVRAMPAIDK